MLLSSDTITLFAKISNYSLTVLTVFAADILGMDAVYEVSLQIEELAGIAVDIVFVEHAFSSFSLGGQSY